VTLNLIPVTAQDYRHLARKRLPRNFFDYIDGGAYSEITLGTNTDDFEKILLKQRVMRDISSIDTSTNLFGKTLDMPLVLAPIGLAGMMARRGEVQAVRAADNVNIPFCLSTVSICSVEEVAEVATKPFWFQLYMMRDRGYVKAILARAKEAGCKNLVFTVDLAVVGARYRDMRNGMAGGLNAWGKFRSALEYPLHPAWLFDVGIKGKPHMFGNLSELVPSARSITDFKNWIDEQFDPSCTWKDIEWLREIWDGNLIIKGILNPEDAKLAVSAGADAIIISNHGGRQLDGVSSGIAMTPRIKDTLGDATTILMDGGVRSGQDIVKAVASGADAVLMGRPWVWALAAKGQAGLETYLNTIKSEMRVSMALTGTTKIADINQQIFDTVRS